jgi:hypothetical protein
MLAMTAYSSSPRAALECRLAPQALRRRRSFFGQELAPSKLTVGESRCILRRNGSGLRALGCGTESAQDNLRMVQTGQAQPGLPVQEGPRALKMTDARPGFTANDRLPAGLHHRRTSSPQSGEVGAILVRVADVTCN